MDYTNTSQLLYEKVTTPTDDDIIGYIWSKDLAGLTTYMDVLVATAESTRDDLAVVLETLAGVEVASISIAKNAAVTSASPSGGLLSTRVTDALVKTLTKGEVLQVRASVTTAAAEAVFYVRVWGTQPC